MATSLVFNPERVEKQRKEILDMPNDRYRDPVAHRITNTWPSQPTWPRIDYTGQFDIAMKHAAAATRGASCDVSNANASGRIEKGELESSPWLQAKRLTKTAVGLGIAAVLFYHLCSKKQE